MSDPVGNPKTSCVPAQMFTLNLLETSMKGPLMSGDLVDD